MVPVCCVHTPSLFSPQEAEVTLHNAASGLAAPRQELVLVASLIDKAANVAGLTRTCEVMRCGTLTLIFTLTRTLSYRASGQWHGAMPTRACQLQTVLCWHCSAHWTLGVCMSVPGLERVVLEALFHVSQLSFAAIRANHKRHVGRLYVGGSARLLLLMSR